MSALHSLFNNYKNVRKPKVFAKLRGEGSGTSHTSITQPGNADIIEIREKGPRDSLDFDGGKPDSYESDILDAPVWPRGDGPTGSPQVKLDIDLAPEALTDWFAANFPRHEASPMPFLEEETLSLQRSRNMSQGMIPDPTAFNGHTRLVTGDADEEDELARSSEEALANLQAMDASHFGSLPGFSGGKRITPVVKKQTPLPLSIPLGSPDISSAGRKHPRDSISMLTSNLSLEESSSAVSGTTLARALFSNTFSLSSDSRSSRYRSGGAGLTRSDSTTLGRGFSFYDTFAVDPNAPPMPAHAESQYEAPKKSRRRHQRRSSTGSLHIKAFADTPSATRPNSLLLSPASEFDILRSPDPWTPPPVPTIPRSPPPSSPLPPPPIVQEQAAHLTSSSPNQNFSSDSPELVDALLPLSDQQMSPETSRWSVPSFTTSTDSQTSSKSADDVLGYYGVPDSYGHESPLLLPGATYRPAVSPIREETSSQLSPPTPYKNDRRDSRRMLPFGARSPGSAGGQRVSMVRSESGTPPRRPSEATATTSRQLLPPLTEDVPTSQPQLDSARSSLEVLPLNHRAEFFNRQRSGSAPTPFLIERSASDPAAATSSQHPANEGDSVAKQDNSDLDDMFISGITSSTIVHDPSAVPLAMQLRSSSQPNLAQHLLISRTGSTGRNSKQLSGGRLRATGPSGRSGSPSRRRIGEISESLETGTSTISERSAETPQPRADERAVTDDEISRSPSRGTVSDGSSLHVSDSSRTKMKSLPRIPVSPIGISLMTGDVSSPEPSASSSTHGSITQPSQVAPIPTTQPNGPPPTADTTQPRPRLPPNISIPEGSTGPSATTQPILQYPTHSPILSSQEIELTGGIPPHLRQYKDDGFGSYRGHSLGSPPPYYSVINEPSIPPHQPPHPVTPSSSSADHAQASTTGPPSATQEWSQNDARSSTRDSRARPRPPLPAGPRRPSHPMPPPVSNSLFGARDRSASVSSSAGAQPIAGPSRPSPSQSPVAAISPKFQTPPPRWRGYTMEAAKWTFTSTELQAVVSRAIRQSAQASSVRLLQLDVLDHHVPQDLRNLEAHRTEAKTRYKVLTRRRTLLFDALSAHISGATDEDPAYAQRLLEDLREMAATLDKLSEELHSLDAQISHLESLVQTHTSSALAIALRKLNTSFLKQMAQNQDLEGQLRDVEAERNEAWNQAQWVADELDQMADVVDESPVSNRSSRVGANRKSSARQSKALLRSSRRFSQLSTYSFSSLPSSKSPVGRLERIPPVPALPTLPRRIPADGFMESPTSPFSTGFTPDSETRAQAQVQDELYAMLGLSVPTLHRSRSWNGLASPPATADPTKAPTLRPIQTLEAQTASVSRRSSLPPDSTLAQVYNAMSAERNAMLLTADMLATTD